MGDEQEAAREAGQERFEPLDAGDVQVVGGLVQQEHVGLGRERAAQQRSPPLPSRERLERRARVELEERAKSLDGVFGLAVSVPTGADHVRHGPGEPAREPLGEERHPDPRLAGHHAAGRLERPGQDREQRGLALAVASEQTDPLSSLDLDGRVFEERSAAEGDTEILGAEQRHGSGGWGVFRNIAYR